MNEDLKEEMMGMIHEYISNKLVIRINKEYGYHLDGEEVEVVATLFLCEEEFSQDSIIIRQGD